MQSMSWNILDTESIDGTVDFSVISPQPLIVPQCDDGILNNALFSNKTRGQLSPNIPYRPRESVDENTNSHNNSNLTLTDMVGKGGRGELSQMPSEEVNNTASRCDTQSSLTGSFLYNSSTSTASENKFSILAGKLVKYCVLILFH